MKRLHSALALLVACLFVACSDSDDNCTPASGPVVTEELFLDPINRIAVEIPGEVIISQGPTQQIIVEAPQSVIDELRIRVVNGEWEIGWDNCVNGNYDLTINITVPELEQIGTSGSGSVTVQDTFTQDLVSLSTSGSGAIEGRFDANTMECSTSGSGNISVSGEAQNLEIRISGSGNVDTFDLPVSECEIAISGSGSASVTVTDLLEVSIAGSGNVRYRGNPTIDSSISGSGQVVDAN
ncbi:MAG: head GIN domain-containing protein [Bacteroidota bacterium]